MDTTSFINTTNSIQITVEHKDTAAVYGSGTLEVFATPAMIALMEKTCMESLGKENTSVGTKINVSHVKACPVGSLIRCESKVIDTDNRRIVFEVRCTEGDTLVGEGTHERFIVDPEKFMNKLKK